jgi:TolB-like protein/cytochrome c-type biogenesis protein CcmH/NrfG
MPTDPPRAVFLSYAREDTEAARRIADALRAFGLEVWFDQNELRGGDAWDQKIRRQIKECALFVPIISATTQARGEGYFRREWKLGVERTHDMAAGVAFIVPVVVDDTPADEATVPEEFLRFQWTRLVHGMPSTEFVEQVKRLLEAPRKPGDAGRSAGQQNATTRRSAGSADPALQKRHGVPGWVWGVISAALVVGIAGAFFLGRKSEPAAATQSLNPSALSLTPSDRPVVDQKSIAVLPFENMSEEKDSAFFTDGIQEDILTDLSGIRELRVVSRTSVMQYRGTTKPIGQIARELGVAYVLEGSVRRAGNKVRVTGQLIRAANDEHVWAKAYDRDVTDIFAIQSELAQAIAGALQAALSPEEKSLLQRRPTDNPAAYDLYLRARQLRNSGLDTVDTAAPLLLSAVQLDPKFAAAWAELASRHAFAYFNDIDHTESRLAKAKEAIDTALHLAPDDPAVMEGAGDYYYYGYRDYARATEQYLRLAQLRPNDPVMYYSLALIQRRQGRWIDSLADFHRAVELDPSNLNYGLQLIGFLTSTRRHDEAEAFARRLVRTFPQEVNPAWFLGTITFFARGSTAEMDEFSRQSFDSSKTDQFNYCRKMNARLRGDFAEAIRLDREQPYDDAYGETHWSQDVAAAVTLADTGDLPAARARAETALAVMKTERERQPSNATLWSALAMAQAIMGAKDEAMRCGQKAVELLPESRDAVDGPATALLFASVLARVGEKDRALAELDRLLHTPFGANVYQARHGIFGWVSFQPLRGDRRFEALLSDPKNNAPLF